MHKRPIYIVTAFEEQRIHNFTRNYRHHRAKTSGNLWLVSKSCTRPV